MPRVSFFGPILQLTRQLWRSVARDIFNHPTMKTSKKHILKSLLNLIKWKKYLLKVHQGYPQDSEFDDTIEMIDAMGRGPAALDEAIEKRGMSNLGTQEFIDHINQRILHFSNLGKP
jgi:hypothetical protein